MTVSPDCDKVLLVQAELDGELGAAEAAALAVHRAECPVCQAAAAELARARTVIGGGELYEPMPPDVRARVLARLEAARASATVGDSSARSAIAGGGVDRRPPWWRDWWQLAAGFGLGAACAAALMLAVLAPGETGLADEAVASHIRALQPGHLQDVASSSRHTVKPWFDGRIDFAPPVKDLASDRFPLEGGRLDYVDGRTVAALVYRRDKHVIDLFIWPAHRGDASPQSVQRHGYNVLHWTADGMTLWAVSDVEASQLQEFAEAWRRSP